MRFVPGNPIFNDENPDDYRSQADIVSAERLADADQIGAQSLGVLIDMLAELTWAFWQQPAEHPSDQLREYLERKVREMGRI